jgi:hypothetical protein
LNQTKNDQNAKKNRNPSARYHSPDLEVAAREQQIAKSGMTNYNDNNHHNITHGEVHHNITHGDDRM